MNTETLPAWRKSSRCETSACVEVAIVDDAVLLRDAKDPGGPVLTFPGAAWADFLRAVRTGEFN